jgi:hydrogenase expression/formation protein HypE
VREGLEFDSSLETDSAPLNHVVAELVGELGGDIHVLRDPTRGGLASALNEIAASAGAGIEIDEAAVPVPPEVGIACDLLGLDPFHVANEGKFVAVVAAAAAGRAVEIMRRHLEGTDAAVIGRVVDDHPRRVTVRSRVGGRRMLDMLSGEQLPRIC